MRYLSAQSAYPVVTCDLHPVYGNVLRPSLLSSYWLLSNFNATAQLHALTTHHTCTSGCNQFAVHPESSQHAGKMLLALRSHTQGLCICRWTTFLVMGQVPLWGLQAADKATGHHPLV